MPGIPNFRVDDPAQAEEIAVGDLVRSYDFEFMDDTYITGRVVAIGIELEGCPRYEIAPTSRTIEGELHAVDVTQLFYPPVNGTKFGFSGGYTNGVRKVPEGGE